jgi:hypothetical protein
MPTITGNDLRFRLNANAVAKTFTITDLIGSGYSTYGILGNFKVIMQVTADGSIIYANAGYATNSFASPDMSNGTSWTSAAIDFPLDSDGNIAKKNIKVFYKVTDGTIVVQTTQERMWDYESPIVDIDLSAKCSTSQLTSNDDTNYDVEIGGVSFAPSTLTRSHTITKPAGSSANAPGTTTDKTRVIGGGSTDETRMWTRVWQVNISTVLAYNIAKWNNLDTEPYWFVVNDTVAGDNFIDVECDTTICRLRGCFNNLFQAWMVALKGNFAFRDDKRDTVLACVGLWEELDLAERCGGETEWIVRELSRILKEADCLCEDMDEAVTHVIVPWSAGSGSISVSPSTFQYSFHTADPPTGGNSGDISENNGVTVGQTGNIWQNVGGTWVLKGNNKGAKGDKGDPGTGTPTNVLFNQILGEATSNGVTVEELGGVVIPGNTLVNYGDQLSIDAVVDLAANDNGKLAFITLGDSDLIDFFTDALIVANKNDNVVFHLDINVASDLSQTITAYCYNGDNVKVQISTASEDITHEIDIVVQGQNSVAHAGDITTGLMTVKLFKVVDPQLYAYSPK